MATMTIWSKDKKSSGMHAQTELTYNQGQILEKL